MHKHVRLLPSSFLAPRQHARRKNRRHPPRSPREVAARAVDQDDIPVHVVNVIGHVVDGELAVREQEVLHGPAIVFELLPYSMQRRVHFLDFGRVLDVVNLEARVVFLEGLDQELALVDKDGVALEVQGFPEEGLVGEAEDEEVTGRGAAGEGVGDCGELS